MKAGGKGGAAYPISKNPTVAKFAIVQKEGGRLVTDILEEWKERGYKEYRPAMERIKKWCSCKWNKFESDHQAEVSAAFDA